MTCFCKEIKANGERCKSHCENGTKYCFQHNNKRKEADYDETANEDSYDPNEEYGSDVDKDSNDGRDDESYSNEEESEDDDSDSDSSDEDDDDDLDEDEFKKILNKYKRFPSLSSEDDEPIHKKSKSYTIESDSEDSSSLFDLNKSEESKDLNTSSKPMNFGNEYREPKRAYSITSSEDSDSSFEDGQRIKSENKGNLRQLGGGYKEHKRTRSENNKIDRLQKQIDDIKKSLVICQNKLSKLKY